MERAFLDGTLYPSMLLMEHAAQAVADCLARHAPAGSLVLFVCGGGNNGGDGCAAARLWMQRGGRAEVWLMKSPSKMQGDAGVNACLLNVCGAGMSILYGEAPELPAGCAAIVDALYGTGLRGAPEGAALSAVQRINASGLPVMLSVLTMRMRPVMRSLTKQIVVVTPATTDTVCEADAANEYPCGAVFSRTV